MEDGLQHGELNLKEYEETLFAYKVQNIEESWCARITFMIIQAESGFCCGVLAARSYYPARASGWPQPE